MPNRIIKESICTSADLSGLSWFEEVLFYRLIVNCDDFGRFDGRVAVIKNRLFPLKENLTMKNVELAVNKLARAGLIFLYEVDGRPFLFLPTWDKHQIIRAKKSKYPDPPENICMQMISNDSKCFRNPIQSNTNPIRKRENAPAREDSENSNYEEKKAYGEFHNVFLTDSEKIALSEKYGAKADKLIDQFSAKLKSKGYKFADHYATIVSWANEDLVEDHSPRAQEMEDWFEERLRKSFGENA